MFGSSVPSVGGFGGFDTTESQTGTQIKFVPLTIPDSMQICGTSRMIETEYRSITCMKEYENKSFEELRYEDYVDYRTGSQSFGTQTDKPTFDVWQGPFGKSTFGSSTMTSGFGSPSTATNVFGSTAAPKPFGKQSTFLFGTVQQPATSTPSFGQPATTQTNFFNKSAQPAFPAPQTSTFSFGQNTAQPNSLFQTSKPNTGFNLFGQSTTTTTGFGQPSTQTMGFGGSFNFGVKPAQTTFGQPTQAGFGSTLQNQSNIFGGLGTKPTFGTGTTGGGLFGTTGLQPTNNNLAEKSAGTNQVTNTKKLEKMVDIKFGVLTVSDTCSTGVKIDTAGPAVVTAIEEALPGSVIAAQSTVADDKDDIQRALLSMCQICDIILTVGGTGFSPRDVTPEATEAVIERRAAGIAHAMLQGSLRVTAHAMLSRAVCGIRGRTVIVNLPGSRKAAVECFGFISEALPHAVDLLRGDEGAVAVTHGRGNSAPSMVPRIPAAGRARHSPYPMVEVEEALRIISETVPQTEDVKIVCNVHEALDRVLTEDITSKDPLPPFPASIKDGYAVIASDGVGVRRVADVSAAGDDPGASQLVSGQVCRISTGAPLPPGADAVVQVEDTELVSSTPEGAEVEVRIFREPSPGQDVRKIGSDIPADTKLLHKGEIVTPAHIGIMAAIGAICVKVAKRPTVGVISTGNELQDPNLKLRKGRIRDSNKSALLALFRRNNCEARDCGIARDTPDDVKAKLIGAFDKNDFVVTTGGVSMGEYDVVKAVLEHDFKAKVHFGRVNMKPGKPMTFATCEYQERTKYIFALPGNPVSAMVTSILFVIPALKRTENYPTPKKLKVVLGESVELDERPEYARASTHHDDEGRTIATVTGDQISSRASSFLGADVLICLPPKTKELQLLEKGSVVEAIRI